MNYIKKSGRFNFRSNKRSGYSRSNNSFPYNKVRTKGNISQMYDKYDKLAKEYSSSGDRIQAEYYNQFADHYSRLMVENGIKSTHDENINKSSDSEPTEDSNLNNTQDDSTPAPNNKIKSSKKIEIEEKIDENDTSLETVSFIAQPASKTLKSKK